MPEETQPDEQVKKGTIRHKLVLSKKQTTYELLKICVLNRMRKPQKSRTKKFPSSATGRASYLQSAYQHQYWRRITLDPDKRHRYTYAMNCPPAGFLVTPVTNTCRNPRICPWCFTRLRLLPMALALKSPPAQFRNLQRVVCWKRTHPYALHELPFFRRDRGPHVWFNASVTAQTLVPFPDPDTGEIVFHHVGVQIVSKDVDLERALRRKSIYPKLAIQTYDDATAGSIGYALKATLTFDWLSLYRTKHLHQFITISDIFQKQQLLRINRWRT